MADDLPLSPNKKFAVVLRKIFGEPISIESIARNLDMSKPRIKRTLRGQGTFNRHYLKTKKIAEKLAQHYPDRWELYAKDFEQVAKELPAGGTKLVEPADRNSFGYALYRVLGGEAAYLADGAERLGVGRQPLMDMIAGKAEVTQSYIERKNWRRIFAKYYPAPWTDHQKLFEKQFDLLPKSAPRKLRSSRKRRGFGYVVGLIIGGENADIARAAKLLDIGEPFLRNLLNEREKPRQAYIETKEWARILSKNYPNTWERFAALFEKEFIKLSVRNDGHKFESPSDKESLGYALWLIVGGENALKTAAARRLRTNIDRLNRVLEGKTSITQFDKDFWIEKMKKYYPDTWEKYGRLFEERADRQIQSFYLETSAAAMNWDSAKAECVGSKHGGENRVQCDVRLPCRPIGPRASRAEESLSV